MSRQPNHHRLEDKDPTRLSDGEWRVLIDWRMRIVEARLDSIAKGMWTIAGSVIVGVLVIWLTSGGHP